jgi:hypothetical protein
VRRAKRPEWKVCVGTLTFRKLFSAICLTGLFALNGAAQAAGGADEVVDIAPGRNYLAVSSEEVFRASRGRTAEEKNAIIEDLANQRADELCAARGFNRVAAAPVLALAGPNAAIGPWADDFAGMAETAGIYNAYSTATLNVVVNPVAIPHRVFAKLLCGTALVEPNPFIHHAIGGAFFAG